MLKKITYTAICLLSIIALFLCGMRFGYSRGYTAGSQATNNWWIEKKVEQFEASEVIKKRIGRHHQAI
jgi:hypothetical protein